MSRIASAIVASRPDKEQVFDALWILARRISPVDLSAYTAIKRRQVAPDGKCVPKNFGATGETEF
ncbi:MAG: hypothetical protein K8S99_18410 [Planctomycetes bacterium]|nr:hypothetical protein [Planctomycetota bacterium]